jgi:hypothetical protein
MRHATAALLGLLLVLGSTSFGMGHVHVASADAESADLHVDHVHLDADHHTHHGEPTPEREPALDHDGNDAITLGWVAFASQAMPKRVLPCLAAAPMFLTGPHVPETERVGRFDDPLADPPGHARPPGRAPPA